MTGALAKSFTSHVFWLPCWVCIEVIHMTDSNCSIIWCSFSVWSLPHFPGCLHFLFTSITDISNWIYFQCHFYTKTEFHHFLGVSGDSQGPRKNNRALLRCIGWWTWLIHWLRDSSSIPCIPSSTGHIIWIHSSVKITSDLVSWCLRMAYKWLLLTSINAKESMGFISLCLRDLSVFQASVTHPILSSLCLFIVLESQPPGFSPRLILSLGGETFQ